MNCKKANEKQPKTKKMTRITIELKKEIVEDYEGGMRIRDLTVAYRIPRTTISTIVKNKDIIKSANVAKGVKSISKQRSVALDHVEKLLLLWITEKQCAGESVSEGIICGKAKKMHADLMKNREGTSQENEVFKASHGWFSNFKKRTGFHNVVPHGEGASIHKVAAYEFVDCDDDMEDLVEEDNQELITEELQELENDEHQIKMERLSSDTEEEEIKEVPSSLIKETLAKWMDVKMFAEKYHPDKIQTKSNSIAWEDQTMSHFKNILRRRQTQSSLNSSSIE